MQNNFEKQVKQKLEELAFVPQPPVWSNIEQQIRKKKERRRMILWLPLFILLSCGSLLWFRSQSHNNGNKGQSLHKVHHSNENVAREDHPPVEHHQAGSGQKPENANNHTSAMRSKEDGGSPLVGPNENKTADQSSISLNNTSQNVPLKPNLLKLRKNRNGIAGQSEETAASKNLEIATGAGKRSNKLIKGTSESQESKGVQGSFHSAEILNSYLVPVFNGKSDFPSPVPNKMIVENSSSFNVVADNKAKKKSKWIKGVTVNAGTSAIANKLSVVSKVQSYSLAASPGAMGNLVASSNYTAQPEIKNGLSFAAGFVLKRQLGKRSYFSTGLQYNYYSTRMKVGTKIIGAALLRSNSMVSDYYLNATPAISNFSNTTSTLYENRYHFITLPVGIEYAPLKNLPLRLDLGISYQRMIASNALEYDPSKGIYFNDNNILKKNQLFSEIGISYSLLKNHALLVGPQYQYSLGTLDGNAGHHLAAFSLKVQYNLTGSLK